MKNAGKNLLDAIANIQNWTAPQWVGFVLVLLAFVLPRLVALDKGADDALDHIALVGGAMMAGSKSAEPRVEPEPKP